MVSSAKMQSRRADAADHPTVAARLADFARGLDLAAVPDDVVHHAKRCVLDALGVAFAASVEPFARQSVAAVLGLGDRGSSTVIGGTGEATARDAALLNGLLVHGLDYDDTHPASIVHCSASALPIVLAAGTRAGCSGAQALAAHILAIEIDARLGGVADGQLQKQGFHPTGIVGIFGATLAAGRLQGLDGDALQRAQGVALSMAAGSMEFLGDGAWTKRLHPGWAASSALTAAALAGGGFEAPSKVYEGRFGLFASYLQRAPGEALAALADDLGERWETRVVAIKPYPVCHFNHAFGDAVLALRAQGLQAEDVTRVVAKIHRNQMSVVCEPAAAKRRPTSDYDAKFSLPYFIAVMLLRGRFTLDDLAPERLVEADVLALCDRIDHAHDEASRFPRYFSGALEVTTRDGRVLQVAEPVNRGSDALPLSDDEVFAKFHDNAARAIPRQRADRIVDVVMALDRADDLRELNVLLAEGGSA